MFGQETFDSLGGAACADVDGDGYGDLILGAYNSDGPGNTRSQAGQIHLNFGSPNLPDNIDLATDPGVILYGAVVGGMLGLQPATGEVNGDGRPDVLADASGAPSSDLTHDVAGRIHLLFGRSDWPASIDLLTGSDSTIIGYESWALGRRMWSADLDRDGLQEILAGTSASDGPDGQRTDSGSVHVFRGRPAWPASIDLATQAADTVVHGVDVGDLSGHASGVAAGDLDGDGWSELLVGAFLADGKDNLTPSAGEARVYEPGGTPPPTVDLRTDTDSVLFGADAGDETGATVRAGDVNGDGLDDLVTYTSRGDGPSSSRPDAGETYVVYGRPNFPIEIETSLGEENVIVYGPVAGARIALRAVADLNGDGYAELVLVNTPDDSPVPRTLWIVSPYDGDGDGVANLRDTCPALANADQADADGDMIGDACDVCPDISDRFQWDRDDDGIGDPCDLCPDRPGSDDTDPDGDGVDNCTDNCELIVNPGQQDGDHDGVGDACDACPGDVVNDPDADGTCDASDNCRSGFNAAQRDGDGDGVGDLCDVCPATADASQVDGDGDGGGDACDCQGADPGDRGPGRVLGLRLGRAAEGTELIWDTAAGADVYAVTRGTIAGLATGYGSCVGSGLLEPRFVDAQTPAPGTGYTYLVQAQSFECGVGPLGVDSSEEERVNPDPQACATWAHTDVRASAETTVFGTRTGSLSGTTTSDDVLETITEVLSGGNPGSRFSRLDHRWTFQVPAGRRVELHVEGLQGASADGDQFVFDVSTDGGASFTPVSMAVLPFTDPDRDFVGVLAPGVSGTVLVRVQDTARVAGGQTLDAVSIDELFLRSIP